MPTLTAVYLDDGLGRVQLTAGDLAAGVVYSIQRRTAFESTWVTVRGGQEISDMGTTVVYDYEYTPNMVNEYRLVGPAFYDSFARVFPAPITEGFETLPLSLTIGQGTSNAPWARSTAQAHTGTWSLQSGVIADSQTSDAVVTLPAGASTIRFWYRVDSEEAADFFQVYTDAVLVFQVAGFQDWTQSAIIDVSANTTVTFRYIKNGSAVEGADAAWVDDITVSVAEATGTGWGTADTGQVWETASIDAGTVAYVNNGVAVVASDIPSGDLITLQTPLLAAAAVDAEITYSAIQPADILSSPVEYNVGLRGTDDSNYYESQFTVRQDTPHEIAIRLSKRVAGVYTGLTSSVVIGTWESLVPWHVRYRVQGETMQMRAWQDGTPEPNTWQLSATDSDLTSGTRVHVRARRVSGTDHEQWFGPMEVNAIPAAALATAMVTPETSATFLKSIQYPSLNQSLECENWDALTRDSRAGLFDIKGRHEILAITDVGSSASFNLTFVTRSKAENRGIVALLTYGGVLLLQPPGDDDSIECQSGEYSGTPAGYVVPGTHVQAHALPGQPLWTWTVQFTQVAAPDPSTIIPTTITWQQLWDIIGPDGTWEDVWATWPTWQSVWSTVGSSESFFQN